MNKICNRPDRKKGKVNHPTRPNTVGGKLSLSISKKLHFFTLIVASTVGHKLDIALGFFSTMCRDVI